MSAFQTANAFNLNALDPNRVHKVQPTLGMEFQEIENTKCCHRLYLSLKKSTILDLVGEPWFRVTNESFYFCSETAAGETVSIETFKIMETGNLKLHEALADKAFFPLLKLCTDIVARAKTISCSEKEKNYFISQSLGDFFRAHYKSFN